MKIRMEQGRLISNNLKAERGYRNPSFLQKMVEHHEIDQYGSAFPKDVFDPHGLHDEVVPSCDTVVDTCGCHHGKPCTPRLNECHTLQAPPMPVFVMIRYGHANFDVCTRPGLHRRARAGGQGGGGGAQAAGQADGPAGVSASRHQQGCGGGAAAGGGGYRSLAVTAAVSAPLSAGAHLNKPHSGRLCGECQGGGGRQAARTESLGLKGQPAIRPDRVPLGLHDTFQPTPGLAWLDRDLLGNPPRCKHFVAIALVTCCGA